MANLYKLFTAKSISVALLCLIFGSSIGANTYYVTTVADTGVGSLRAAIDSANANGGADSIVVQLFVSDTIFLTSPLPTITDSLVISGLACQNPTISGALLVMNGSAFHATNATAPLVLNYLNIVDCTDTASNAQGAAVRAHQLYVNYCYFEGNSAIATTGAGKGGAIFAVDAWLSNSTFYNNAASDKTLSDGLGGAINISSIANLSNCTFDNNYSAAFGGAILSDSVVITNCTIVNNSAGTSGGAIAGTDSTSIANSIVWNNTAASSAAGFYFDAPVTSVGCNVLQTSSENFNFTTGSSDISGTNPMLDSLSYYNGCVPVMPVFCGSVAQNLASCTGATTTDAQGIPAYGIRDAGAFEITPPVLGGDTIDSIQPGTTADLVDLFNTSGLTFYFTGNYTDSTQVDTGTYSIIATNYLGCSDTAIAIIRYGLVDTTVDTTTGIRNINAANAGISLFPNPTDGKVNVRLANVSTGPVQLSLLDETGRLLSLQSFSGATGQYTFDVSGVSSGLYYVQITDASGNRYASKLNVITR